MGEECERICITKNHKSSLVPWAPLPLSLWACQGSCKEKDEWEQSLPAVGCSSLWTWESHLSPAKSFLRYHPLFMKKYPSSECPLCARRHSRCHQARRRGERGSRTRMSPCLTVYWTLLCQGLCSLLQHKCRYIIRCVLHFVKEKYF